MELELKEYLRQSRCDINRCRERAKISIGNIGGPVGARFNICMDDLEQIVRKGAALLGIEFADPELIKQLEEKDGTIGELQLQIANSGDESLKAQLLERDTEIANLKAQLEAKSAPKAHTARTARSMKGGKAK